jgi:hypothetical protein
MSLEKRIEKAEDELKPEEAGRDLLITVHTEQHVRVGDELVPVKREAGQQLDRRATESAERMMRTLTGHGRIYAYVLNTVR